MADIWLPSPAKINLFLHVLGRRVDGYHLLQTVFQFLDYYDHIGFSLLEENHIQLKAPNLKVATDQNLITRAAYLLQEETGCRKGAEIILTKNIPLGSGLGGGSSNAATTLLVLNQLWDLNLTEVELADLGLQLGADVPIFIHGRAAFAEGIGQELQSIEPPEDWILLLQPDVEITTAKIFSDSELTRNSPTITIAEFLANGGHNDCEPITRKHFPEIAQAMDYLNQYATAKMTGTGSSVFAVFKNENEAQEVAKKLPSSMRKLVIKGLNFSPLHVAMKKINWGVAKR